jgi:hypothetical protein
MFEINDERMTFFLHTQLNWVVLPCSWDLA